MPTADPRLFIGVFPTGILYADRHHYHRGQYRRLAFLPFKTLTLEWDRLVDADLFQEITLHAAEIVSRRGKSYLVSGSGQTVTLGE